MGIEDVLLLSDTDTVPVMDVGSVVVPKDPEDTMLLYPHIKGISNVDYQLPLTAGFAIVINMSPFTLATANGNMRWQTKVDKSNFKAVGKAKQAVLDVAMTRLIK